MSGLSANLFVKPTTDLRPAVHGSVVALKVDSDMTVFFGVLNDCTDAIPAIDRLIEALTSLRALAPTEPVLAFAVEPAEAAA